MRDIRTSAASIEAPPESAFGDGVFCPDCGYHLRGIPEVQCPECGLAYDHRAARWAARVAAGKQDQAARGTIRAALAACAALLNDAGLACWPSLPVQFSCVLLALLAALVLWWHFEDLRAPSPWSFFWKFIAFLACFDVAVLFVVLPSLGRWLGLICCFFAWAAWLGHRPVYREALAAIETADRQCVQSRMVVAQLLLGLSSLMAIMAWR